METFKRGNSITSCLLETPEHSEEADRATTHSQTFPSAESQVDYEGRRGLMDIFHDCFQANSVSWPIQRDNKPEGAELLKKKKTSQPSYRLWYLKHLSYLSLILGAAWQRWEL